MIDVEAEEEEGGGDEPTGRSRTRRGRLVGEINLLMAEALRQMARRAIVEYDEFLQARARAGMGVRECGERDLGARDVGAVVLTPSPSLARQSHAARTEQLEDPQWMPRPPLFSLEITSHAGAPLSLPPFPHPPPPSPPLRLASPPPSRLPSLAQAS